MSETSLIIKALKRSLREHGVTYAEISKPLELSEASVKRLFSEEHFSLKRIETICRYLGISFSDLVNKAESDQNYLSELTAEQERELISDVKLVLVTQLVFSDWQFDDILRIFTLSKPELIACLVKLDKLGLIELLPNNRFKLLTAKNFKWRKDGPVQSYFRKNVQEEFFQTDFADSGEEMSFMTGMLSTEAHAEFLKKLDSFAREFDQLCKDDAKKPLTERRGYAVVLAIRPWTLSLVKEFIRE